MRYLIVFLSSALLLSGCNNQKKLSENEFTRDYPMAMSVLYNYYSSEYKALSLQAYTIASAQIIEVAKHTADISKLGVVVDIDETLLDNSPYQAKAIVEGFSYPTLWNEWCNLSIAKAIPGSLEFLSLADSLGYRVFYISNRKKEFVYDGTMLNLDNLGFPQVDSSTILLREKKSEVNPNPSDKQFRRDIIKQRGIEIVLYVGDNIGDFYTDTEDFDARNNLIISNKINFGLKYIVLPNPMYGNWTSSIGLDGSNESILKKLNEMAFVLE